MIRRLWRRKPSFLWILASRSVGYSAFQKLKPVGFCVLCEICGNYKQRRYKHKEHFADKLQFTYHHYIFRMNPNIYHIHTITFPLIIKQTIYKPQNDCI